MEEIYRIGFFAKCSNPECCSPDAAPSMSAAGGPFRRLAENVMVRRAKRMVEELTTTEGFSLISDELRSSHGLELKISGPVSKSQLEVMYKNAVSAGLTDEAIVEFANSPSVNALGDGRFLEIIRNIIEWLSDPANQEKIMAVVRFIMMMLAMFGI